MATYRWIGGAPAVAQQDTLTILTYHAATIYTIFIGGVAIATSQGAGTTGAVAIALQAAFEASTHPYAAGITALAVGSTVVLTGDVAGVPFYATESVAGGSGTASIATDVEPTSGYHFNNHENWQDVDTGLAATALPTAADSLIMQGGPNVVWDGPLNGDYIGAEALASLVIYDTYAGRIGTDSRVFTTSADGQTVVQTVQDYTGGYRQTTPRIYATDLTIGRRQNSQPGTRGPSRVNIQHRVSGTIAVESTGASSADIGLPIVRIISMISSGTTRGYAPADLTIDAAPGGVLYGSTLSATTNANSPCPTDIDIKGAASRVTIQGVRPNGNSLSAIVMNAGQLWVQNTDPSNPTTGWRLSQYGGTVVYDGAGEISALTLTTGTMAIMNPNTVSFTVTMRGAHTLTIPAVPGVTITIGTLTMTSPDSVLACPQNGVTVTQDLSTSGTRTYR